jgi:hypothetical protein
VPEAGAQTASCQPSKIPNFVTIIGARSVAVLDEDQTVRSDPWIMTELLISPRWARRGHILHRANGKIIGF